MTSKTGSRFAAIAAVTFGAVSTSALATPLPGEVLCTMNASSSIGRGSYNVAFEPALYNEATHTYVWELAAPVVILDKVTSLPLATLNTARLVLVADPSVDLI